MEPRDLYELARPLEAVPAHGHPRADLAAPELDDPRGRLVLVVRVRLLPQPLLAVTRILA